MSYTKINLMDDVENVALKHGLGDHLETRFARSALGLEKQGLGHFRIAPGFRLPFGHVHTEQEEVYLVVEGSARVKLDDEIVELATWDAVRVPPGVWRGLEGGADGAQVLALGAPNTENGDVEMQPGWWAD